MNLENFEQEEALSAEAEHERQIEYEKIIVGSFETITANVREATGMFSAVDVRINTPEARENHMQESWVRDTAWNLVLLLETADKLKDTTGNEDVSSRLRQFAKNNLLKSLDFLNQPRWLEKFHQEIVDHGAYTSLSMDAPEVHVKADGSACSWDQNQPEPWGVFLAAAGKAREQGSEFTFGQIATIKAVAEYLIRIKPWKFAGAGMWEGLPGHSPSSRSNALAIAKGLEAAAPIFSKDPFLQKQIADTVEQSMAFVREDPGTDYTAPGGHPRGGDLAMLASMALPETKQTKMPFVNYVEKHKAELQIGSLPGAIRYAGDTYKKGERGEARWFMADPILAIGYFREAGRVLAERDLEQAKHFQELGQARLRQALDISKHYGYEFDLFPELFVPRDPQSVRGQANILERKDGDQLVALEPLPRSLVWNTALVMTASAEAARVAKEIDHFSAAPTRAAA